MNKIDLFPTTLQYKNYGNALRPLNKRLVEDIETEMSISTSKGRSFGKNDNAWQSKYDMEHAYFSFKEFASLLREIVPNAKRIRTWANVIHRTGGFSRPHRHNLKVMTGVYYPKGLYDIEDLDVFNEADLIHTGWKQGEGQLVLFDPTAQLRGSNLVVTIEPRESLLLFFPPWLTHMVAPMTSDTKRYCISFSIYT